MRPKIKTVYPSMQLRNFASLLFKIHSRGFSQVFLVAIGKSILPNKNLTILHKDQINHKWLFFSQI